MSYLTPSLESAYWAYKENYKNIDNTFERIATLRNRVVNNQRVDRSMLEGFAFKDNKVAWAMEGFYMGNSPKSTMALAMEELTNVEIGLVAAATVGVLMVLQKIWQWLAKMFNRVFNRDGDFGTGDKAMKIVDNSDDIQEKTSKVTSEVKKASAEVKPKEDDLDGMSAKHLALATREGMAAINKVAEANATFKAKITDINKHVDAFEALVRSVVMDSKSDKGTSITQAPQYKSYIEAKELLSKLKQDHDSAYTTLKELETKEDQLKKEVAQHIGQAYDHLDANAKKIFAVGHRSITSEEIKSEEEKIEQRKKLYQEIGEAIKNGGDYTPETIKAISDFLKDNVEMINSQLAFIKGVSELVINITNTLHHLCTKYLAVVKKNDPDNTTLIDSLNEAIKCYQESTTSENT